MPDEPACVIDQARPFDELQGETIVALSSRGEFWQEYWSYHRRRYPEDVRDGWADSNARHATADSSLSLSLYLMVFG